MSTASTTCCRPSCASRPAPCWPTARPTGSAREVAVIAGLLGGTLAAGTHIAKTGTRALINTSPEPFSNIAASLAEDATVIGGLALAIAHPITFLCLLALFVALLVWLLPKLRAAGADAVSPHGPRDKSLDWRPAIDLVDRRALSFVDRRATLVTHHVHPPEHPDPAVLPHHAGDALPVSAAPAGDQARHRAERSGRDLPARHADRRRLQAVAPLRLQAAVRRLPRLRAGPYPRARLRAQPRPAPHPAPQRACPRHRGPGAGDRRAVRAVFTLCAGPPSRRRHGRHGFRRLSRDGRGEPGRDRDHRVPRRFRRRPAGRRLPGRLAVERRFGGLQLLRSRRTRVAGSAPT